MSTSNPSTLVLQRLGPLVLASLPAWLPAQTWDGGGGDDNWNTALNWVSNSVPVSGSAITFAGSSRLAPNFNIGGFTASSLAFQSGAGAFTLSGSATLTLGTGGITQNSSSLQTITHALSLSGSQTWNTASGDLAVSGAISSGWITFTKAGSGTLTLSGNNAGLHGPAGVSAGTLVVAHNNALGASNYGNTVSSGATLALQGGIALTEGDLTLAGTGVGGAGALRSLSGANTLAAALKLSAAATVASDAGQLTLANPVNTNGHAFTLTGAGDIVVLENINGGGAVTVSGSGNRTLSGRQINASALTFSGSGVVTSTSQLNLGGGNLTLSGSGDVTLGGSAINVGNVVVSGSGNTTLNTHINASGSFTQSGDGITTFGGSGTNYFSSVNITGGEVVLDQTGGYALQVSGPVAIVGAEIVFAGDNQVANWNDVTLGDGATLYLNDTSQSIDNLTVAGNAIIDFGSGGDGSSFDVNSLTFSGDHTLTILNWNDTVDAFFADVDPGGDLPRVIFDGYGETGWNGGSLSPGAPVPEPGASGFLTLGGLVACAAWRRRGIKR